MRTLRDATGLNRLIVLKLCSVGESHKFFSSFRSFRPVIGPTARQESPIVSPRLVMETETKQELDSSGIDTMYIVFYLDYARQLFKLSHGRSISGPTLAKEAQVLLEKWQNRGGDTSATRSSRRSVDVSPSASASSGAAGCEP